ncbi:MAG: glutamate--tRNA ligase [Rhodobiaceae bacterium]|nr:glutamate--tRNA ligase [Rhodobiaceae bacterium]
MTDPATIVRFAPSPTGLLHIGNARTALFNALFAIQRGGRFVLRLDDTDKARSTQAFADAIVEDVAWLGIDVALLERQSARLDRYADAVERLKAAGRLYPAYETPDELDRKRKRQRARGLPPVYDRAALKLTDAEKAAFEAEGRQPHWRFLLANHDGDPFAPHQTLVEWGDLCRGHQSVDLATVSDPVLVRADGSYLYTLPSVVDDIDMEISHVIRGEDHVTNAGVQIDLFRALGAAAPGFAHHNLLTLASGEALSKRTGSMSVRSLRQSGLEAATVASLAVLIGTSHAVAPHASLADLAAEFDLGSVSRAPARFDPEDLDRLNAKLLHETRFEAVAGRLDLDGIADGEAFWVAICGNITRLAEAGQWVSVVRGPLTPVIDPDGRPVLDAALDLLPDEPYDATTWSAWTGAIKAKTGAKGRGLFMPLRLALTGLDHGPELAALLPLIGRVKSASRLAGRAA